MDFGLVTIHFRQPHTVEELVTTSRRWDCAPLHTVVVDNSASTDEPIDVGGLHHCDVISSPENLGYAAAANLGLARLRERGIRYALVMTQEARLSSEASALLLSALQENPAAAVSAPLLEYASEPGTVFSAGGELLRDGRTRHRAQGQDRATLVTDRAPYPVDWADGAILLLDLDATAQVGDFDPRYFLYVEEIDLQLSLRQAGRQILIVPTATGWQEPGNYPTYLRYRNNRYLTQKFSGTLRRYPWRRLMLRDVVKKLTGRLAYSDIAATIQGVDAARRGVMGRPGAAPRHVAVLCEFSPEQLHTGVAGRLRHVQSRHPDAKVEWVHHETPRSAVSLASRLTAARTYRAPEDADEVIVLGLGSPPMMHLARRLHRQGTPVRLDLSDSVLLQWHARRAAANPKLLAVGAWMIALHAISPVLPSAYISDRDARADRFLNRLRPVEVIPASAPPALTSLPAFTWPAQRIVCSGDFSSFHNAAGLDLLLASVRASGSDVPIELFGPAAPTQRLPENVVYRGWADSADQLLSGNSVAFISNRGGSGVPNKLCEAIAAGRPVIVHTQLRDVVRQLAPPDGVEALWYDDVDSLQVALAAVAHRSTVVA